MGDSAHEAGSEGPKNPAATAEDIDDSEWLEAPSFLPMFDRHDAWGKNRRAWRTTTRMSRTKPKNRTGVAAALAIAGAIGVACSDDGEPVPMGSGGEGTDPKVVATGGGDGRGGDGGDGGDGLGTCAELCAVSQAAGCGTEADCLSACTDYDNACAPLLSDFLACGAAQVEVSCVTGTPLGIIDDCELEALALLGCEPGIGAGGGGGAPGLGGMGGTSLVEP